MCPIKVAVRVHCLRLHPKAEIKAQSSNFLRKTADAAGKLVPVRSIITEPRPVGIPGSEPSVIEYEKLTPK